MRDFTLAGFAAHLGKIAAEMAVAEHEGLERAAQIVEAEAKASAGHYQDQSGPFAAWGELAPSTQSDRASQGFDPNEPELRTGEMRDSIAHSVGDKEATVGSDSEILEYQELGTSRMPPRSILGGAAVRKSGEAAAAIGADVVSALVGDQVHLGRLLPE